MAARSPRGPGSDVEPESDARNEDGEASRPVMRCLLQLDPASPGHDNIAELWEHAVQSAQAVVPPLLFRAELMYDDGGSPSPKLLVMLVLIRRT